MKGDLGVILLAILGIIALLIVLPIFYFLIGALVGWIISVPVAFVGQWVISGMALLHVELSLAQLPLFCGTLGFISAYFLRSTSTSKK